MMLQVVWVALISSVIFFVVEYVPWFDKIEGEDKPKLLSLFAAIAAVIAYGLGVPTEQAVELFMATLAAMGISAVAQNTFLKKEKG